MLAQIIFFNSWENLAKVLIVTPILYISVIFFVRLTGKRSTSQMNNFDWVVTVAIGSIIASPILLKDVSIAQGVLAVGLLFGLQWVLTNLMVRSDAISELVRDAPTILVYNGELRNEEMTKTRVSHSEIMSAVRENGHAELEEIALVVLESDANLSVIPKDAIKRNGHNNSIGGLNLGPAQEGQKGPNS